MFKDSAGIFIVQIALAVIGILLGAVLARSLPMEDMGRYALILSYLAIGQITALPGMNAIISKGVLKDYDPIYYAVLKRSIISSSIFSLLLFVIGGVCFYAQIASELGFSLIIVALFLPVIGLEKYESFFQGKREFTLSRRIAFFSSLGNLLVVGGTAFLTKNLLDVIIALLINRVLTIAFCLWIVHKRISVQPLNQEFEENLLKQGWQMSILSIFNVMVGQIDRVILGALDFRLLAIYHIGSVLPKRIKDNVKVILVVPITYWAKLSKKEHLRKIKQHGFKFVLFGCCLTAIIWVLAPWFIPFIYGKDYHQSVAIARWLSLTLPVMFLGTMILTVDIYQGDTKFYQKMQIGTQSFYILALAVLVPIFGIYGVVASFVARAYVQHGVFPFYYMMINKRSHIA
jgi:O-antigen/teichoic acid export membrane protein